MSDSLTELHIKKQTIEIKILTHLQNYKHTLQKANDIGAHVLRELNAYGEQLDDVDDDLKKIQGDLDESDGRINSISSIFKAFKSVFVHHENEENAPKEDAREKRNHNDLSGFKSSVDREMKEIISLLIGLHGEAEEINAELRERNDLIEKETAERTKFQLQLAKGIAECDKLLMNDLTN